MPGAVWHLLDLARPTARRAGCIPRREVEVRPRLPVHPPNLCRCVRLGRSQASCLPGEGEHFGVNADGLPAADGWCRRVLVNLRVPTRASRDVTSARRWFARVCSAKPHRGSRGIPSTWRIPIRPPRRGVVVGMSRFSYPETYRPGEATALVPTRSVRRIQVLIVD